MKKKIKNKKALILAGGLGTRLRPFTFSIPKPLIPVRGRPIIDCILKRLQKAGFTEIYISLNYHADIIRHYLYERDNHGLKIHFFEEKKPLGTAGPLSYLKKGKISQLESILVINGDILTDMDFKRFLSVHERTGSDLTIGTIKISEKIAYGVLSFNQDMDIIDVREKPSLKYNASAGIYLVKGKCLRFVPSGNYSMPELIKRSSENGMKVKGYQIKEHWMAIEHIKNLEEANEKEQKHWTSAL